MRGVKNWYNQGNLIIGFMIKKTIAKIESSIGKMGHVDPRKKKEIRRLLATLKTEIEALSKTHQDQARRITTHIGTLS